MRIEALQLEPHGDRRRRWRRAAIDLAFGYLPELTGTEQHAPARTSATWCCCARAIRWPRKLRDRAALRAARLHPRAPATSSRREALHLLGLESRIRLTLPHFTVAPSILAATDLAVVMPLRPALRFAARHALQVVEPDLGLPPFTVAIHWTWRAQHDPRPPLAARGGVRHALRAGAACAAPACRAGSVPHERRRPAAARPGRADLAAVRRAAARHAGRPGRAGAGRAGVGRRLRRLRDVQPRAAGLLPAVPHRQHGRQRGHHAAARRGRPRRCRRRPRAPRSAPAPGSAWAPGWPSPLGAGGLARAAERAGRRAPARPALPAVAGDRARARRLQRQHGRGDARAPARARHDDRRCSRCTPCTWRCACR